MRKEYTYPLVISCGKGKFDIAPKKSIEAYRLYDKGGYWQVFRNNSPQLPLRIVPTYVISAKYGLIPHTKKISPYELRVSPRKKPGKNEITIDEMIDKLKSQKTVKNWKGSKDILFIGSEEYKESLEGAGFKVHRIEQFEEYPGIDDRNGVDKQKGALKWYLSEIVPKIKSYQKKQKDKMVNKVAPIVIENLHKRFSNEQYFDDMGKSYYEVFSKIATDTTKGAKTKSSRRKLRERKLQYDPYEWSMGFLRQTHNIENQYIDDIPIAEIIRLHIDGMSDYFDFTVYDDEFIDSSFYMSKEDLEDWFDVPKKKADNSPIYDRFAFLELAMDLFYFDYEVGKSLQKFILAQKKAEYIALCRKDKISPSNKSYCKKDGYYDRLEETQKELAKSIEKASRIMNRYPIPSLSFEQKRDIYRQQMKQYTLLMEEYHLKLDDIDKEERKARKILWESQKKKLDNTPYLERKKAIPIPQKPQKPQYFESQVQQKLGRDSYVILVDFIGRFLAGIEDRLILVPISKKDAFAYIKKHHSALPDANPRGLMMTLAVQDTDGKIGAVATVNTPTGRWDLADRGEDFDHMNVIELTRVASDGSIKGASSMLTGRAIDLLPFLKRGDPNKQDLFVTYSLDSEEGSTYRALRDKGLRPTQYIKGQVPQGARKGADVKKSLANIDKIRWEAGSGALKGNWDLLELVGDKK